MQQQKNMWRLLYPSESDGNFCLSQSSQCMLCLYLHRLLKYTLHGATLKKCLETSVGKECCSQNVRSRL